MRTLTITESIANFLQTDQKSIDWRYLAHELLRQNQNAKVIYWIGIIDLHEVSREQVQYPVSFINWHKRLTKDASQNRDVDGLPGKSKSVIQYQLPEILEDMLIARNEGFRYFHILLEESVSESGRHCVSLLHKAAENSYGIASHTLWINSPTDQWCEYSHQKIDDSLERIIILRNSPYHWMK